MSTQDQGLPSTEEGSAAIPPKERNLLHEYSVRSDDFFVVYRPPVKSFMKPRGATNSARWKRKAERLGYHIITSDPLWHYGPDDEEKIRYYEAGDGGSSVALGDEFGGWVTKGLYEELANHPDPVETISRATEASAFKTHCTRVDWRHQRHANDPRHQRLVVWLGYGLGHVQEENGEKNDEPPMGTSMSHAERYDQVVDATARELRERKG